MARDDAGAGAAPDGSGVVIRDDRTLLDLLCANHARGLIFASSTRLPSAARTSLRVLRNKGLVAFDRFLPSASAIADWQARQQAPAPVAAEPLAKPECASSREGWTAARKAAFLAAIRDGAGLAGALVAVGLSATTKKGQARARRADPAFDEAVAEALEARKQPRRGRPAAPQRTSSPLPAPPADPVEAAAPERAPEAGSTTYSAEKKAAFLDALAKRGLVGDGLVAIGLARTSVKWWQVARGLDDAFAASADEAIRAAKERLKAEAQSRPKPEPAEAKAPPSGPIETATWTFAAQQRFLERLKATGSVKDACLSIGLRANAGYHFRNKSPDFARRWDEVMTGRPRLTSSNQGAHAFMQQQQRERWESEQARLADPVEQAKTALRRRGRTVYSMSVHDGPADRFFCSGLGRDVTGEQLIAEAERLAA
jgi:hypothetical protein